MVSLTMQETYFSKISLKRNLSPVPSPTPFFLLDQGASTLVYVSVFLWTSISFLSIVVQKKLLVTDVKFRVQIMNVKTTELVLLQMEHKIVSMYQVSLIGT